MDFTIRIAGVNIGVNSIYNEVYTLCHDYITNGAPDIIVSVSSGDIANERMINLHESHIEGNVFVVYPDSYLETLAVYRKIAELMLDYDTFLMHGAVVAVKDCAWLFTAPSGMGKTTHIRLWLDNIPESFVVNGDKPLIHIGHDITVYGTPWAGKEGMQKNIGVKLCGIVILERGIVNHIEPVSFSWVLPTLIGQSFRPNSKKELEKSLKLIKELGRRIPFYRLQCNMLPEAALTAYKKLCEDIG